MERHPLRANNLSCRMVEAALDNLVPLPIRKISEDRDSNKIVFSRHTPLLQAHSLGQNCHSP